MALTTKQINQKVIQSVIDDARWLIWRTATPSQIKRVQQYKDRGYIWYCAGAGWVHLANFDSTDGGVALTADTVFGAWKFADEEIPALINWHGLHDMDWKKRIKR